MARKAKASEACVYLNRRARVIVSCSSRRRAAAGPAWRARRGLAASPPQAAGASRRARPARVRRRCPRPNARRRRANAPPSERGVRRAGPKQRSAGGTHPETQVGAGARPAQHELRGGDASSARARHARVPPASRCASCVPNEGAMSARCRMADERSPRRAAATHHGPKYSGSPIAARSVSLCCISAAASLRVAGTGRGVSGASCASAAGAVGPRGCERARAVCRARRTRRRMPDHSPRTPCRAQRQRAGPCPPTAAQRCAQALLPTTTRSRRWLRAPRTGALPSRVTQCRAL